MHPHMLDFWFLLEPVFTFSFWQLDQLQFFEQLGYFSDKNLKISVSEQLG